MLHPVVGGGRYRGCHNIRGYLFIYLGFELQLHYYWNVGQVWTLSHETQIPPFLKEILPSFKFLLLVHKWYKKKENKHNEQIYI